MSLSEHEDAPEIYASRLGTLFVAGITVLNSMVQKGEPLIFHTWSALFGEITEVDATFRTETQRKWLWDAIRTEPSFKSRFGELPATTVPRRKKEQPFRVFHTGQWFVIGMKRAEVAALLKATNGAPGDARVSVWTKESLDMKPGKGDHMECCDCGATVTIRVNEVYSVDREADIMRIDSSHIKVSKGNLTVEVDSLNQAYTISSRRLEPERRSHGGRIYGHVVHVAGTKRTLLGDIRQKVETGTWKIP